MSIQALDPAAPARHWCDESSSYGRISRLNHWVLAALMIAMLLSGLVLGYAPLAQAVSGTLRDWHKALGVVVLVLGLWRVGWRLVHGFPKSDSAAPEWQAAAAKAAHWALLAAIVVMPLSGVLMTLLAGRSINLIGLTIPGAPEISWLASFAREVHSIGGLVLAGLVTLHVSAALKHHLMDRDDTLQRMRLRRLQSPEDRPAPATLSRPSRGVPRGPLLQGTPPPAPRTTAVCPCESARHPGAARWRAAPS